MLAAAVLQQNGIVVPARGDHYYSFLVWQVLGITACHANLAAVGWVLRAVLWSRRHRLYELLMLF